MYTTSSGKLVDDLGLPNTCVKNPARAYFTAEINAAGVENEYRAYLGVCFSSKCDEKDMNQNGGTYPLIKPSLSILFLTFRSSITPLSPSINQT